ncbi:hypothetical protein FQV17_0011344, partial [Megadyptes antipodes antipodes]
VKALKEKIESEKGRDAFPVAGQKLIYAGKILNDDTPLKEYKIDEKNFVVVMVTKLKRAAVPTQSLTTEQSNAITTVSSTKAAAAPTPVLSPIPAAAPVPAPVSTTPTPAAVACAPAPVPVSVPKEEKPPETPTVLSPSSTGSTTGDISRSNLFEDATSALVISSQSVRCFEELFLLTHWDELPSWPMGLRPSWEGPEQRAHFFAWGIPGANQALADPPHTGSTGISQSSAVVTAAASTMTASSSGGHPLDFLRNQPQFQQMRQIIQQNPSLLPALLQQIGRENPQLLQQISQHQEHFIQMLNEPVQEPSQGGEGGGSGGGGGGSDTEGVSEAGNGHMNYIQVTPQEKEAIERLKALGFPEGLVIQAYFACEKNENLAANFLLQQNFDED